MNNRLSRSECINFACTVSDKLSHTHRQIRREIVLNRPPGEIGPLGISVNCELGKNLIHHYLLVRGATFPSCHSRF